MGLRNTNCREQKRLRPNCLPLHSIGQEKRNLISLSNSEAPRRAAARDEDKAAEAFYSLFLQQQRTKKNYMEQFRLMLLLRGNLV